MKKKGVDTVVVLVIVIVALFLAGIGAYFLLQSPEVGIDVESHVNEKDADGAPGPTYLEGENLTFTYRIKNTGDVSLKDIDVTDNRFSDIQRVEGDEDGDGALDPDEVWIYETQETAKAGNFATESEASGDYEDETVTDVDETYYFGASPAVDVEKYVSVDGGGTYVDADVAPGPVVDTGDDVYFKFVVTNEGNVELSEVSLEDSEFDVDNCTIPDTIAPEESFDCVIGPKSAGPESHTDAATVNGEYAGRTVEDSDEANYKVANPSIDIEKYTNGVDADEAPGPWLWSGTDVRWTYEIKNDGNVDLDDVVVRDSRLGQICTYESLAQGETRTYAVSGTVWTGQYANTGIATGVYDGSTVRDRDSSHYYGYSGWSLPPYEIDVQVVGPPGEYGTYFDIYLSNVGCCYKITTGTYPGWCADSTVSIPSGVQYISDVYSSVRLENAPSYVKDDEEWNKVNWILNHKSDYPNAAWKEFQNAMWFFLDDNPDLGGGGTSGYDEEIVNQIINDAEAYGEGFVPGEGQVGAVILVPRIPDGGRVQLLFIVVDP